MKPSRGAQAFFMMGGILLALGIVPLWLTTLILPDANPLLFGLAFMVLTPTGIMLVFVGLVIWLISALRR